MGAVAGIAAANGSCPTALPAHRPLYFDLAVDNGKGLTSYT